MYDEGKPSDHAGARHPLETLEVTVAEPLVPAPASAVALTRGEAHRLHDIDVQNIESLGRAGYLVEEILLPIADHHSAVHHLRRAPDLI